MKFPYRTRGIWLLRRDSADFQLEILSTTNGFIHCHIIDINKHTY